MAETGSVWGGLKDGFTSALEGVAPLFAELGDAFDALSSAIGDVFGTISGGAAGLPSETFRAWGQNVGQDFAYLAASATALLTGLIDFFEDRVKFYFRDVRGFAYDEVNAAMAAGLMLGFGIGIGGLGVALMGILVERFGIDHAMNLLIWLPLMAGLLGLSLRTKRAPDLPRELVL